MIPDRYTTEKMAREHRQTLLREAEQERMLAPDFEGFKAEGIDCAGNREDFKHILAFLERRKPLCMPIDYTAPCWPS